MEQNEGPKRKNSDQKKLTPEEIAAREELAQLDEQQALTTTQPLHVEKVQRKGAETVIEKQRREKRAARERLRAQRIEVPKAMKAVREQK